MLWQFVDLIYSLGAFVDNPMCEIMKASVIKFQNWNVLFWAIPTISNPMQSINDRLASLCWNFEIATITCCSATKKDDFFRICVCAIW